MRREVWAFVVAAFLMLLLAAPHVEAKAATLSLTVNETATLHLTEFERHWVDDAGIDHYRNMVWDSTFVGTFGDGTPFKGTGVGLLSWNLDPTTGNGDLFGEFSWTFTNWHGGITFYGRFSGTFDGGVIHDFIWAHGEGMQLMGNGVSGEGFHGVILIPHG